MRSLWSDQSLNLGIWSETCVHFATTTPCSICSSTTAAPLLFRLSRYRSTYHFENWESNDRNLLLAPEEELHRGHKYDRKPSEEDENLVPVLVFWGVVCRKQYHCKRLAKLNISDIGAEPTWNPKHPGIRDNVCHSNEELSQIWISCI